jgi:hypothetical protein
VPLSVAAPAEPARTASAAKQRTGRIQLRMGSLLWVSGGD